MIDQQKAKEAYESFVEKARNDSRILGVILSGGRGKGAQTENSDYDVVLVSTDEDLDSVKSDYPKTEFIDSLPHAISEFREHAKTGTRTQYDKYTFTHNKVIIDKNGEIQKLVDEKGVLESERVNKIVQDALGGYLNSLHRSLKNLRDENMLAGHLDACETVPLILTFVFAIEGRVKPFNKFLKWELENYPLLKLPISSEDFLAKLKTIATNADFQTQKELLEIIRQLAMENGQAEEIKDWEGYYFG
jgi:predicted nucleotidyltransferase